MNQVILILGKFYSRREKTNATLYTRNHEDLSTEAGFQFEFNCDCCGNGLKSAFIESTTYNQKKHIEPLGSGARAPVSLFGGKLNDLGWARILPATV